jgi:hypothetical protein
MPSFTAITPSPEDRVSETLNTNSTLTQISTYKDISYETCFSFHQNQTDIGYATSKSKLFFISIKIEIGHVLVTETIFSGELKGMWKFLAITFSNKTVLPI